MNKKTTKIFTWIFLIIMVLSLIGAVVTLFI